MHTLQQRPLHPIAKPAFFLYTIGVPGRNSSRVGPLHQLSLFPVGWGKLELFLPSSFLLPGKGGKAKKRKLLRSKKMEVAATRRGFEFPLHALLSFFFFAGVVVGSFASQPACLGWVGACVCQKHGGELDAKGGEEALRRRERDDVPED